MLFGLRLRTAKEPLIFWSTASCAEAGFSRPRILSSELVKGSLNTFLNAMTYPDKTMYPVASCNDKDFRNLMHVYLDAVFYPNIYQKKEIFLQEGWSYQLESPEDAIVCNGVVYNESERRLFFPRKACWTMRL